MKKKNMFAALSLSAALVLSMGTAAFAEDSSEAASLSIAGTETAAEGDDAAASGISGSAETEAEAAGTSVSSPEDAMDPASTSAENPAPLGQWVNFGFYTTADSKYHDLQVRVIRVFTYSENPDVIDGAIALNNSLNEYSQVDTSDLNLPSDVELALVQYEVNIPSDFPVGDYGLFDLNLYMNAKNPEGGGIPSADGSSSYIGLGSTTYLTTEDFGDSDMNFEAGKTYTAYAFFAMVQGYRDYVFEATTYPDGTGEASSDSIIYVYFAGNEAAETVDTEAEETEEAAESETQLSAADAAAAFQDSLSNAG